MLNRFAFGTLDERTVRRRVDSLPDQGASRRVENLPDQGKSRRVVNLPDHGASARESGARARVRSRQVQGPDTPYTLEELSELDAKGLPDPISADQKKIIMDRAHDSYHQPVVACSVCDQFCSLSATELLLPCELPPAVFTVLQPSPEAEPLSAELLAQYDISRAFLAAPEVSFSSALLSFEGVVYDSHEADFAQDGDGDLPEACSDGSCAFFSSLSISFEMGSWASSSLSTARSACFGGCVTPSAAMACDARDCSSCLRISWYEITGSDGWRTAWRARKS